MKNIIVMLSLIFVVLFYEAFQGDFNSMIRQQEMVKDTADLAVSSAMLSVNPVYYGDGWIVYEYDEANKQIKDIVQKDVLKGKYMNDSSKVYTYFFDYSNAQIGDNSASKGTAHSFVDGVETGTQSFTWGEMAGNCTDIVEKSGQNFAVNAPCAACFVDRGRVAKLSVYEYKTN